MGKNDLFRVYCTPFKLLLSLAINSSGSKLALTVVRKPLSYPSCLHYSKVEKWAIPAEMCWGKKQGSWEEPRGSTALHKSPHQEHHPFSTHHLPPVTSWHWSPHKHPISTLPLHALCAFSCLKNY